ncbi:Choloylglycine hydrolase [Bacillus pseudomycoides]|nr:Choloylglycine hydrolase [Bacillus pseudomycoides]EEM10562.1 Choloylglycine hydrolase [Bacillus pseudomycoides]KFN12767.1 putative choloylglycine hydrolase [Bacillus pseudomycoides]MDR4189048.1 choloylglycine hydrolase [Bacillus pseudomycoides]PDZ08434.1 choloylglycine hydrolase [Bacillus pseudomycoides]
MFQVKGYFASLSGSYYEIGRQQGEFVKNNPFLVSHFIQQEKYISDEY